MFLEVHMKSKPWLFLARVSLKVQILSVHVRPAGLRSRASCPRTSMLSVMGLSMVETILPTGQRLP